MASVALDGTRFDTADGLTRPGTWPVSRRHDPAFHGIPPSFARP